MSPAETLSAERSSAFETLMNATREHVAASDVIITRLKALNRLHEILRQQSCEALSESLVLLDSGPRGELGP